MKDVTHEMQFILWRLRAYVYSWSEYVHLFGRDTYVAIPDLICRRYILFPYILSTENVQQISVHGLVGTMYPYDNSVAARLLLNIVVRYIHVAFLQMV